MKNKEEFAGFQEHEYRPIVRNKSIEELKELIGKYQPKDILEIGTFIGYSASVMLDTSRECFVTTIEIDKANAENAVKNLNELGFSGRFEVVNCDALEYLKGNQNKRFDFVFLDGPKGQYIKYLPLIKSLLKKGGIFVADDVLFYGLVRSQEHIEHKHRTIVNNLRKFLAELENDDDFETEVFDFANGMSVSKKKI